MRTSMHARYRVHVLLVLLCGILAISQGCRKEEHKPASSSATPASTGAKTYPLEGEVLAKNPSNGEITVKHGNIPGFMPAMTMVYKTKDPSMVQQLNPGDQITADILVPENSDDYRLSNLKITGKSDGNTAASLLPAQPLKVGEKAPEVPLVNQDGKTIHLKDYQGKALLVTFIYTRCPLPTACPLITSRFAKIYERLGKEQKTAVKTHLLSISLDPSYDTSPVLRKYGLAYLDDNPAGFARWEFANTTTADLKKLAQSFGLEYAIEDNQITHTMQTILIGPDSTILQTWNGSSWDTDSVANAVKAAADRAGK